MEDNRVSQAKFNRDITISALLKYLTVNARRLGEGDFYFGIGDFGG